MSGQIQNSINVGHRHPFWTFSKFYDFITRANFSFLQNAKVESRSPVRDQEGWHARLVHANAYAVAGYPGLCHFEHRLADAVSIANADLVVGKSFNRKIFSELAETEIIALKEMLPVVVRIHLVYEHGTLLPTVTGEIGLCIAVDVQPAHHPSILNGKLPDRCSHSCAVPCDLARKTDIEREQSGHLTNPLRQLILTEGRS
jgi:hypothetical protein